ncbi:unannotated protein [freshwater metagenome]|uniref:Unannotated protein n=1 Tax=freshwater metagenome TaxID=449393 RepID=A0A6J6AWI6_9ZZZZ
MHSLSGLAEHRKVRICSAGRDIVFTAVRPLHGLLVVSSLGREVGLEADDCLDVPVLGLFPHLKRAEQGSVVCHRNGGHLLRHHLVQKATDASGAVEHGVVRVHVQMDERTRHGGSFSRWRTFSLGRSVDGSVRRVSELQEVPTNAPNLARSRSLSRVHPPSWGG